MFEPVAIANDPGSKRMSTCAIPTKSILFLPFETAMFIITVSEGNPWGVTVVVTL